jgi:hypothetical protein
VTAAAKAAMNRVVVKNQKQNELQKAILVSAVKQ